MRFKKQYVRIDWHFICNSMHMFKSICYLIFLVQFFSVSVFAKQQTESIDSDIEKSLNFVEASQKKQNDAATGGSRCVGESPAEK